MQCIIISPLFFYVSPWQQFLPHIGNFLIIATFCWEPRDCYEVESTVLLLPYYSWGTEAQKESMTCPRPYRKPVAEPEIDHLSAQIGHVSCRIGQRRSIAHLFLWNGINSLFSILFFSFWTETWEFGLKLIWWCALKKKKDALWLFSHRFWKCSYK